MKTKTISFLLTLATLTPVLATEDEKVKSERDSTKVENAADTLEVETEFNIQKNENQMSVTANGSFDEFASVSITTTRGTDLLFSFISTGKNDLTFDLSSLESGTYYVVLNTSEEIRIKPFVKD